METYKHKNKDKDSGRALTVTTNSDCSSEMKREEVVTGRGFVVEEKRSNDNNYDGAGDTRV